MISSFVQPASTIRLVIAMSAFGLGIDIPDEVIHWVLTSTVEEYIQESGKSWSGWTGSTCHTIPGKREYIIL